MSKGRLKTIFRRPFLSVPIKHTNNVQAISVKLFCKYSGLNLNQDKATKPQTVQTDSTEPIHLVLQHLRESFSLS